MLRAFRIWWGKLDQDGRKVPNKFNNKISESKNQTIEGKWKCRYTEDTRNVKDPFIIGSEFSGPNR